MLILQIGVPRSGNLWLHYILKEILQRAGIERKGYVRKQPIYLEALTWEHFSDQADIDLIEINEDGLGFRKGSYLEAIENLDHYFEGCVQVWTHSPWVRSKEYVYKKFDKRVYIVRDPRDVAISAASFAFSPFILSQHPHKEFDSSSYLRSRYYEHLLYWVHHVGGYLLQRNALDIHFVFYERLIQDFDKELEGLLRHLEIELKSEDRKEIYNAVTFESMRNKNPSHLRLGKYGQWPDILNQKQKSRAVNITGARDHRQYYGATN